MKKIFGIKMVALLVAILFLFAGQAFSAEKKFLGLADVPKIKNRKAMHIAIENPVIEPFIKKFSKATGIKITIESMLMSIIYPKINVDLISRTGAYDVIVVEASTTNEWAKFMIPFKELAAKYHPGGVAAFEKDIQGIHPLMLRVGSDFKGTLYAMPYYTYQQVQFVRKDVFDHPTEKANFKKKYGYDLAPATTWTQTYDQAQFFTRKKGELLKEEPLKEDLYGTSIMAGRYEINDEISCHIWSRGVDWRTTVRDASGKIKEFVITKKNKEALAASLTEYKSLLPYCSPACLSGYWDVVMANLETGKTIFAPHLYTPCDPVAMNAEVKVPGAYMIQTPCVGGKGYTGAFCQGIPKKCKNPEAAFWLAQYVASYECQKELSETGWAGIRRDVYEDPKYKDPKWHRAIGERAAAMNKVWNAPDILKFTNDLFYFNSDAVGKIYEMEIIVCHEAMTGERTIENAVKEITKQTLLLQKSFGTIPIREE